MITQLRKVIYADTEVTKKVALLASSCKSHRICLFINGDVKEDWVSELSEAIDNASPEGCDNVVETYTLSKAKDVALMAPYINGENLKFCHMIVRDMPSCIHSFISRCEETFKASCITVSGRRPVAFVVKGVGLSKSIEPVTSIPEHMEKVSSRMLIKELEKLHQYTSTCRLT
jgi:hypothetical protein